MGTITWMNTVQYCGRVFRAFQPCSGPVSLVLQTKQCLACVGEHSLVSAVATGTQSVFSLHRNQSSAGNLVCGRNKGTFMCKRTGSSQSCE